MLRKKKTKINWWLLALGTLVVILLASLPKEWIYNYPQMHQDLVIKWSQQYDVNPNLVYSIIKVESNFKIRAESSKGAKGLMQIMPETGQWIAAQLGIDDFEAANLYEPDINIQFGCWYLASLAKEFEGRLPQVIAAYNAGRGMVSQWNEADIWNGSLETADNIPYKETQNYLKAVWKKYQGYQSVNKI